MAPYEVNMKEPRNSPRLPMGQRRAYKNNTYSIYNHTRIMGLGALSPFYCESWNSRVVNLLREVGVDNLAWYDEFQKHYKQDSYDDVIHVYQFEQIERTCHRCQKVKRDMWWTPIRNGDMMGTPDEASKGILKAIEAGAFCALCSTKEGIGS